MRKQFLTNFKTTTKTSNFFLKPTINYKKFSTQQPNPNPPPNSDFDFQNLLKKIKQISLQYWEGCKLQIQDFKKANQLRKEISYRLFRRANRKELLFLNQAFYDFLKFVPFIVVFMLPGATLIIPGIAYFFPFVLPSRLQPKDYSVKIKKKKLFLIHDICQN